MRKRKRSVKLYTVEEIINRKKWPDNTKTISSLLLICYWIENYLTKPHAELGRKGPVCPYTEPSLDKKTLFITHLDDKTIDNDKVIEFMLELKEVFLSIEPMTGAESKYKTILTIFPNIDESQYHLVGDIQKELKLEFISDGLMVGQFHSQCNEGGVKNSKFKPLKSPIPLLAIRQIVAEDIVFMKNSDTSQYNMDYMEAYFKRFANKLPNSLVRELVEKLAEA